MYAAITHPLTFATFLTWDDASGRAFELRDGIPVPLSEPNANHEDLIQRLCAYLEAYMGWVQVLSPICPTRLKQ